MKPLISVVIPVFNGEEFVRDCIKSILEQTMKELQIIIIDDGSEDHTLEIIQEFSSEDERIMIIHQNNAGVSKARNVGLQAVQAEWVIFVDADDIIEPDYCVKMLDAASKLNTDVIVARPFTEEKPTYYILQEKEKIIQACLSYDEISYSFNIDAPWGKLFRYSVIWENQICFPEKLTRSEDAFFCLRYYEAIKHIGILNYMGYKHTERNGSLCHSFSPDAPETLERVLNINYQWVMQYHANDKKYLQAVWYRVLPGIVECERNFFLHQEFSGSLVIEYKKFLKKTMIHRAISKLKLSDVVIRQYQVRLLLYKLNLGWLFIMIKR